MAPEVYTSGWLGCRPRRSLPLTPACRGVRLLEMSRRLPIAIISLLLLVGQFSIAQAEPLEDASGDTDIRILDQHFALHLGGSIGAAGFSVGALALGIQSLVVAREEASTRAAQSRFVLGLTLTSMGIGTVISASTGIYRSALNWHSVRKRFLVASPAQKRLLRAAEIKRLQAMVGTRAIGLIADSAFLAIGIVLMAVEAGDLGMPLVMDGALVLGIDIFRLVVDHQFSLRWQSQDLEDEGGYFSRRTALLLVPVPMLLPGHNSTTPPGGGVVLVGAF